MLRVAFLVLAALTVGACSTKEEKQEEINSSVREAALVRRCAENGGSWMISGNFRTAQGCFVPHPLAPEK